MDKPSARRARMNYRCLRCGYEETQIQSIDECKEVIVCPQCQGAAVDRWKYIIYQAEHEDRKRLDDIVKNAMQRVTNMRDNFNNVIKSKREYVLSEDDFNWLVGKVKEKIKT